jgi:hypothetical protein
VLIAFEINLSNMASVTATTMPDGYATMHISPTGPFLGDNQ